jgi:type III secretory pathway component EscU
VALLESLVYAVSALDLFQIVVKLPELLNQVGKFIFVGEIIKPPCEA